MAYLKDDLVSYWKMDETSDGSEAITRVDSHGSNDLTDNNTTKSGTGKINNCADMTLANDEYLSVADNSTLDFTTEMSISCWFNMDNAPSGEAICISAKWTYDSTATFGIQVHQDNSDDIEIYIADRQDDPGDNKLSTTNASLSADTWYHLVVVYNGAGADNDAKLKVYINGVEKSTSFIGSIPASLINSTAPLNIGDWGGSLDRKWDGLIDEFGIWGRVLTQAEITQLYNNGDGLSYDNFPVASTETDDDTCGYFNV